MTDSPEAAIWSVAGLESAKIFETFSSEFCLISEPVYVSEQKKWAIKNGLRQSEQTRGAASSGVSERAGPVDSRAAE